MVCQATHSVAKAGCRNCEEPVGGSQCQVIPNYVKEKKEFEKEKDKTNQKENKRD